MTGRIEAKVIFGGEGEDHAVIRSCIDTRDDKQEIILRPWNLATDGSRSTLRKGKDESRDQVDFVIEMLGFEFQLIC